MTANDDLKAMNEAENTNDANLEITENLSKEELAETIPTDEAEVKDEIKATEAEAESLANISEVNSDFEEALPLTEELSNDKIISDEIIPEPKTFNIEIEVGSDQEISEIIPVNEIVFSSDELIPEIEDIIEEEENIDYDTYTRENLVEAIEKAVKVKSIEKIKRKIGLIKLAYIKLTKEEKESKLKDFLTIEGRKKEDFKPEQDVLEERFNNAFFIYKDNKKKFDDSVENEKQTNLEKKKLILEDIKKLIDSNEELKYTYDTFKKLQFEWKEIGQVPHTETNNLWQSYHFLVEKFLDKVRINEELRDLDRKKNFEQCIELCEKAEELIINPSINESYRLLQQYHNEWKEIGNLPLDKKEEVWERFRQASVKVNERRKEYFEKNKVDLQNNLASKSALCEKIEEIVKIKITNSKSWQEATDKVIEIQNLWKTIGTVPPEDKDLVWKRFREAINIFFDNKKEHFEGIKEEYLNNYNLKLAICNQAEALKLSQDWKNVTNDFIKLQNEWKRIGSLPKKQSDELWRKFRKACDYFFDMKQEYFSHIDEKEKENLDAKLALIEKVKNAVIEGDSKQVFDVIKEYQREFTAIGHVPVNEKEKIQNLFRDVINAKFDELKINPVEKKVMGYKSKFETLKNDPNQYEVIKNEIRFVSNKLTQLTADIQLWENNIGFFANSKSANILKQEFEKKIELAKEEFKILEEKLKFLKAR